VLRLSCDQDELYRLHDPKEGDVREAARDDHFSFSSDPYLTATEFPWKVLGTRAVAGRSVWCVAGSGDVPLWFSCLGARELFAFDISRPACCFNELKRAALGALSYESFLTFFFGGLDRARSFLESRSLPCDLPWTTRLQHYARLRETLSRTARSCWDPMLTGPQAPPQGSPFQRFVRGTDLFFLKEIPYLESPETFDVWKEACRAYPILNVSWERALEAMREPCDILYLSNVLEYVRHSRLERDDAAGYARYLERSLSRVAATLSAGGEVLVYVFHGEGSASLGRILDELQSAHGGCFRVETMGLQVRSALLGSSLFRHALVRLKRRG
jgi:hypothetical protein